MSATSSMLRCCGLAALAVVALATVGRGPAMAFLAPQPLVRGASTATLRGTRSTAGATGAAGSSDGGAVLGGAIACGAALSLVAAVRGRKPSKTAVRYTTQTILPSLQWLKTGIKASDLAPGELYAQTLGGVDVLIGKDGSGTLFCIGNLCPHFGTPMSEGADVIGDVIVCPLHGSSFSTKTGELIDWCPSPPIIGPLTGLVVDKKNILIIEVRQAFLSGDVEALVDTNAKRAYEADYWKGLLDAQGKNDGTYY